VLVWKLGIVGVAIGTLFAMSFRTIEFMYHTSKYILNRSVWDSIKRLFVIAFEVGMIALIINIIPKVQLLNYQTWIIQAIEVTAISAVVVITTNCIIDRGNLKMIFKMLKNKII